MSENQISKENLHNIAVTLSGKDDPEILRIDPDRLPKEELTPSGIITPPRNYAARGESMNKDSPENLQQLAEDRDALAPHYNTSQGYPYEPNERYGYLTLPVLLDLWGTAWNAAAANFLQCLRPSMVRVIGYRQSVTLDIANWRVTVYLDTDNKIDRIEQEVKVGLVGFRNGHDASLYYRRQYEHLEQPQPQVIINLRGINRLQLNHENSGE